MRRQGLGPVAIGAFVGSLYLPWAFKWITGPFVDAFSSDRFGRRRLWILMMQIGMMVTLVAAMPIDYVGQLGLFTAIIFLHNCFGATQDVAIDALAVNVLPEHERGVANGFMFAGASIGQAVGGAGVLFLTAVMPFGSTYIFVAGAIMLVTIFVVLPLKEPKGPPRVASDQSPFARVSADLARFVKEAWQAFTGSRGALIGVIVALLPFGAYALSLALQSNLAVWIMPIDVTQANRPTPETHLVVVFWAAVIAFNVFQGLYYGVRAALFMDVTTPAVAATQFTAYMAMSNLVITYTSWWQGLSIVRWGYPATLVVDSIVGLAVLFFLPFMTALKARKTAAEAAPGVTAPT
jgi:PAT family beta-lactamase induction signal transducer AmpG